MDIFFLLKLVTIGVGFYMAWTIGANDVSNAIGTSVGTKALPLKKAVILAALLEFAGAFFLGSHVSETIQEGIVNPYVFSATPMIYVLGMVAALLATGIWLHLASYLGLPVSTTHAIVGSVLGFGALIGGIHAVYWDKILSIAASWVLSPVMSGFLAYFLFSLLQKRIFFSIHPLKAAKRLIPILVFISIFTFSLTLIYQGLAVLNFHPNIYESVALSIITGLIGFFIGKIIVSRLPKDQCIPGTSPHPMESVHLEKAAKHLLRLKLSAKGETRKKASSLLKETAMLKKEVQKKSHVSKESSIYNKIENQFKYLQMISACMIAFAHGANDVSNAIGPVAAVFDVLNSKVINTSSNIPTWILLLGGSGIVIGLATWGWRVIETIGKKITTLTPTRGFSAELGASLTILVSSKLGLPISTTHALVGAVLGVGIAKGISAINLRVLRDIVMSWLITIPVCALLNIVVFYILKFILL